MDSVVISTIVADRKVLRNTENHLNLKPGDETRFNPTVAKCPKMAKTSMIDHFYSVFQNMNDHGRLLNSESDNQIVAHTIPHAPELLDHYGFYRQHRQRFGVDDRLLNDFRILETSLISKTVKKRRKTVDVTHYQINSNCKLLPSSTSSTYRQRL